MGLDASEIRQKISSEIAGAIYDEFVYVFRSSQLANPRIFLVEWMPVFLSRIQQAKDEFLGELSMTSYSTAAAYQAGDMRAAYSADVRVLSKLEKQFQDIVEAKFSLLLQLDTPTFVYEGMFDDEQGRKIITTFDNAPLSTPVQKHAWPPGDTCRIADLASDIHRNDGLLANNGRNGIERCQPYMREVACRIYEALAVRSQRKGLGLPLTVAECETKWTYYSAFYLDMYCRAMAGPALIYSGRSSVQLCNNIKQVQDRWRVGVARMVQDWADAKA